MKYAEKYGVSRASRKYNKSRSYIYFWKQRWDGSVASLTCQSRRPHSHPNQHTEAELKLICGRPDRACRLYAFYRSNRVLTLLRRRLSRLRAT